VHRLEGEITKFEEIDRRYFWVRLGVLFAGAVGVFAAYQSRQSTILLITGLVFVLLFSLVVFFNRKVKRSIVRFSLSKQYHVSQLARMDLDWKNIKPAQIQQNNPGHPFASDLNLTGANSMHQLMNTAASLGGGQRLENWLLHQDPKLDEVQKRQTAVQEIQSQSGFRSRLTLSSSLATEVDEEPWDGEQLLAWLESNIETRTLKPLLLILGLLAAANISLFLLFSFNLIPAVWIITLAIYVVVYLFAYRDLKGAFSQAQHLSSTLDKFRAVLIFLEAYTYLPDSYLKQLCQPFWQTDRRPSAYLRRISLLASAISISGNPVVWLLVNVVVPWDIFFTYQLEQYKLALKNLLPEWLNAWYELEALNSLGTYAYLNPGYVFPQITETASSGEALFLSKDLGHPLIPDEDKVCNDFNLGRMGEVVLITGSNMSGKSTFLRTVGVNLCLAFAGAPVNATYLKTRTFRLFSVIQVSDSLTDGISYFYAEVRRLRALLDALDSEQENPLFFLIDEIFRGTNNRERQIGGRAFVTNLVDRKGVGLISTHDLDLVTFADDLPEVDNFHFEEEVTQGRLFFDYQLRSGPSKTTNALAIMRMEGLPINSSTEERRN
jgi:ABC-type multidrug transport system fused ATPase/permease subunit